MNEEFSEIDFEGIDILFCEIEEKIIELKDVTQNLIDFFKRDVPPLKNNVFDRFEKALYKFGMTLFEGDGFRDENKVGIIVFYEKISDFLEKNEYGYRSTIDKAIFSQIEMTKDLSDLISKFRKDKKEGKLLNKKEKAKCKRSGLEYKPGYDDLVDEFMKNAEVKLCELANKKFPIDYY